MNEPRSTVWLNAGWRFHRGDAPGHGTKGMMTGTGAELHFRMTGLSGRIFPGSIPAAAGICQAVSAGTALMPRCRRVWKVNALT